MPSPYSLKRSREEKTTTLNEFGKSQDYLEPGFVLGFKIEYKLSVIEVSVLALVWVCLWIQLKI